MSRRWAIAFYCKSGEASTEAEGVTCTNVFPQKWEGSVHTPVGRRHSAARTWSAPGWQVHAFANAHLCRHASGQGWPAAPLQSLQRNGPQASGSARLLYAFMEADRRILEYPITGQTSACCLQRPAAAATTMQPRQRHHSLCINSHFATAQRV